MLKAKEVELKQAMIERGYHMLAYACSISSTLTTSFVVDRRVVSTVAATKCIQIALGLNRALKP